MWWLRWGCCRREEPVAVNTGDMGGALRAGQMGRFQVARRHLNGLVRDAPATEGNGLALDAPVACGDGQGDAGIFRFLCLEGGAKAGLGGKIAKKPVFGQKNPVVGPTTWVVWGTVKRWAGPGPGLAVAVAVAVSSGWIMVGAWLE